MKRFTLFLAALAGIAVFTGCPNGGGDSGSSPQAVTYTSIDASGNTYELIITENGGKAAYAAQIGDSYVLTITPSSGAVKISRGIVESVSGGSLTLKPSYASESPVFTITVAGETISAIVGTITLVGGETEVIPAGAFSGDSSIVAGIWIGPDEGDTPPVLIFNASDSSVTMLYGQSLGTYSLNGTVLTLTIGSQSFNGTASVSGNTLTISGFNEEEVSRFDGKNINLLNAAYSKGGKLNLNEGHPKIKDSEVYPNFTVWVRNGNGDSEWSGAELNGNTFGTWVDDGGYYDPDSSIVAATPGQPSNFGSGNSAPLKWISGSRTGSYDVFIETKGGPPVNFTGRYKNNVPFTDGVASITIDASWTGWTLAEIGTGGAED